jgi:hypothetical protein
MATDTSDIKSILKRVMPGHLNKKKSRVALINDVPFLGFKMMQMNKWQSVG